MTNRFNMISEAGKVAKRSHYEKHRTGCVIADDDIIIARGWSHAGTWQINDLYSVHSEIHALMRGRYSDLTGCIAYVATLTKAGKLTESQPCITCALALHAYGINIVIYTTKFGVKSLQLSEAIASAELKEYRRRGKEIQ